MWLWLLHVLLQLLLLLLLLLPADDPPLAVNLIDPLSEYDLVGHTSIQQAHAAQVYDPIVRPTLYRFSYSQGDIVSLGKGDNPLTLNLDA